MLVYQKGWFLRYAYSPRLALLSWTRENFGASIVHTPHNYVLVTQKELGLDHCWLLGSCPWKLHSTGRRWPLPKVHLNSSVC